jgi:hypothetical protein
VTHFLYKIGFYKSRRGCVDNAEARVAPGSTVQVQVYSSWLTVYLCTSKTGLSKVCVLYMCAHCLLPQYSDFYLDGKIQVLKDLDFIYN